MDVAHFETVARLFAQRRFSRRAIAAGAAGLAAARLTDAASARNRHNSERDAVAELAGQEADHGPTMLFVQSFQSGGITSKLGAEDRYTVTLEHGLGQTIYFSDRPDRLVGATPTPRFLEGLGFPADNPPNAALVVETAPGETTLAVVELFEPRYDEATHTATYEAAVLKDWRSGLDAGFAEAPADLATLSPSFGVAHLFIDDCADRDIECRFGQYADGTPGPLEGTIPSSDHDGFCYSYGEAECLPCQPWFSGTNGYEDAFRHWKDQCNQRFAGCMEIYCYAAWD